MATTEQTKNVHQGRNVKRFKSLYERLLASEREKGEILKGTQ